MDASEPAGNARERGRSLPSVVPLDRRSHPWAWLAFVGAVAFYVVGDGVTTLVVLASPTLVEQNGLVVWLGPIGFVLAKAAVFGVAWGLGRVVDDVGGVNYGFVVVAYCGVLAVHGLYLTVSNLGLILASALG